MSPEGVDIDADLTKPGLLIPARRQLRPWLYPTRWVLAGGVLIALATLLLTVVVILQMRQREARDAFERLRSMDVLLAEQTAGAFKSVDLVLDRVADEIQARGVRTADELDQDMSGLGRHLDLASKIAGVPQLDAIAVIDSQGRLVNFSRYYPVPAVNLSDHDYFGALRNAPPGARSFISKPVDNRANGAQTIYIARRLSAPDGSFLGIVVAAIQTEWFRALYDGVRESGDLAISVWRDDGDLLVHAPPVPDNPEARRIPPNMLPLIRHGVPTLFHAAHGTPYKLFIASTIPNDYPVVVSVTQPESSALAAWLHDAYTTGAAGLTCAVLVLLLTFLLRRQFRFYEQIHDALRARDAAERGREYAEQQLRQAQKMEAIGQLTAGLSHDFNNTLLSVVGGVEQLERELGPGRRALDLIRQATERATAVTRQLLAFSRQSLLQPQPVALGAVLSAMRPLLESSVGHAITLDMRMPPDSWPVFADASQVEQVVLNLVLNARDAMPSGGRLVIEGRNLSQADRHTQRPPDLPRGDHVCLVVQDTGVGMEPQVALRAFDPFFTTKPQGKGTGLGLSQVYGVAKQSGGGVLLASVPAEGTTVTVFLPRSYQAPATAHDEVPAPDRLPNSTVLVVDDDPLVRETVVGAVAVLGCQPDSVPDGGAALRRIEDGPVPDVIVLDFAMPGLNGADAARAIRALRPDVPIIFMTGHADPTPLTDERWILVKPFRTSQLARVLAEALGVTPA